MALQAGGPGPYAPPGAVSEVVERYRERGLQTPITTEVLERVGIPESLCQRTLQALRVLDFVEADGSPTREMEALSRAPEDEYKNGLRELLTSAYAEVFSFADPATDDIAKVRDAFRAFNPRGQQERMVTLFLGLCEWAELDATAALKSRKGSTRPDAPTTHKANGATTRAARAPQARKRTDRVPPSRQNADTGIEGLPPALVGLLHQIPRSGETWTQDRRNTFLKAFEAVLDYSCPVDNLPEWTTDADDEDGDE